MGFLIGLILGATVAYTYRGRTKDWRIVMQGSDIMPRYVTHARRMALLFQRMPMLTSAFVSILNDLGRIVPPESKADFDIAVDKYNDWFLQLSEGWKDLGDVAGRIDVFFREMEDAW